MQCRAHALAIAAALATTGCPAPLPPVHAFGSVGAARGSVTRTAEPVAAPFTYTARLGVNPLGYAPGRVDRDVDFGVGYALEQQPTLGGPPTLHGPYVEADAWPSLAPAITARLGARAFGELLMLETDGAGRPDALGGHREVGWGVTLALAWEAAGSSELPGMWERRRTAATFGYGRAAWGLFVAGSYRDVAEPYGVVVAGVSVRLPVTVADVVTR